MDASGVVTSAVSGEEHGVILPYRGAFPRLHETVFVAEGAIVVGDAELGEDSSVWFNAVIRGDVNWIRIGDRTNIQDGCLLHVTGERYPLTIGSSVTVGHGAIVHGAMVKDHCLIGMGSRVLDNAQVGPYTLVAAGSVVLENSVMPGGTLVAGSPARVIRSLTEQEKLKIELSAQSYISYARTYQDLDERSAK